MQALAAKAASALARWPRTRTCSSVNQAQPKSTPTGRAVARLGTERQDASRLRLSHKEEAPDTPNHARADVRTYSGPVLRATRTGKPSTPALLTPDVHRCGDRTSGLGHPPSQAASSRATTRFRRRPDRVRIPIRARCSCAPVRSNSRLAEQQLEVLELAQERVVLALELLVGLSGRLEHREGEGTATVA